MRRVGGKKKEIRNVDKTTTFPVLGYFYGTAAVVFFGESKRAVFRSNTCTPYGRVRASKCTTRVCRWSENCGTYDIVLFSVKKLSVTMEELSCNDREKWMITERASSAFRGFVFMHGIERHRIISHFRFASEIMRKHIDYYFIPKCPIALIKIDLTNEI